MREILFRGKDVNSKEWRLGYYYTAVQGAVAIIGDGYDGYQVKSETVGQYTGLCDKNGVKIFEGDILQGNEYPYYSDGKYNYYAEVVFFDDDCFAAGFCTHKNPKAKVKGISDGNCELIEDFISDNWLVIGNIYDNPELVK